jgi:hypothetical protein
MRCVALISGGLDSQLAARVIQLQGIDVEALHFTTLFCPAQDGPAELAARLGVRLTVCALREDYLDTVCNPRFGYGRAANPCLDCRIFMFRRALEFMQQVGAEFVVTGEIAGQQSTSQRRRDLETIAHHSGLLDRLLRPLSAKILAATLPERERWVDRERLYGFFGRGRRGLIQLARDMGVDEIPAPSAGCALSELQFSRKFFDLLRHTPHRGPWAIFELMTSARWSSDEMRPRTGSSRSCTRDVAPRPPRYWRPSVSWGPSHWPRARSPRKHSNLPVGLYDGMPSTPSRRTVACEYSWATMSESSSHRHMPPPTRRKHFRTHV